MKPIRIFTHVACEPPGYLQNVLDQLHLPWQQVCLYDGHPGEVDGEEASALVFMGGPGNVNEPTDWMQREFELIRRAHARQLPMLGICLGAQLMSKALGGEVWTGDDLEVGWSRVRLTAQGRGNALFDGVDDEFPVFQWHAHSFSPPSGAISLARNHCAPCQAWVMQQHLALQFHLEMTEPIIRSILDKYSSDLAAPSDCVQRRQDIVHDITSKCRDVFDVADHLLVNWFRSVIPADH